MATDRQIAANRSNGSVGREPKTSAGKARSRGPRRLDGQLDGESRACFHTMMKKLLLLAFMAVASEAMAQDAQCVPERAAMVEIIRALAQRECVGLDRCRVAIAWGRLPTLVRPCPDLIIGAKPAAFDEILSLA